MRLAGTLFGLGIVIGVSGCADALVGGQCASGFVADGDVCVPIVPVQTGGAVGSGGDAAGSTGSGTAGAGGEEPTGSGSQSGGGHDPGATGSGAEGGAGSTGTETGNGGTGGGQACDPSLTYCNGACVDLSSDADNCGACGVSCATEICVAGQCTGGTVGDLVVLGMNYKASKPGAPAKTLLGNSVFLAPHEPVRILDYREFAASQMGPSPSTSIDDIVDDEAIARGRSVTWTLGSTANQVPGALATGNYDVLLVHDEPQCTPGMLGAIGSQWAPAIDTFAKQGGVVVVMATAAGTNDMAAFLTSSGVLQTSALTPVTGQAVDNVGWLDAIGQNVASPFLAKQSSASLITNEIESATTSFVVVDTQGAPVAVHKVVLGN